MSNFSISVLEFTQTAIIIIPSAGVGLIVFLSLSKLIGHRYAGPEHHNRRLAYEGVAMILALATTTVIMSIIGNSALTKGLSCTPH